MKLEADGESAPPARALLPCMLIVVVAPPRFTIDPMATVPSWQLRQSLESPSGGFCGLDLRVDHWAIPDDGTTYDAPDSVWLQRGVVTAP